MSLFFYWDRLRGISTGHSDKSIMLGLDTRGSNVVLKGGKEQSAHEH